MAEPRYQLDEIPNFLKKIRLDSQVTFSHHRSGWRYAVNALSAIHNHKGIYFDGYLDGTFQVDKTIREPFVGFFHNAPFHPHEVSAKYKKLKGVNDLLDGMGWKKSQENCLGIFVLSDYLANFIRSKVDVPVSVLRHPTEKVKCLFDFEDFETNPDKKLVCIGHWMRRFETLFEIRTKMFRRCFLMGGADNTDHRRVDAHMADHPGTLKISYMSNYDYDHLLTENIVGIDLYDASANNVVVECIVRQTPLLIRRIPPVEEYLGKDYPLFFDCPEDASEKIDDMDLLKETADYMANLASEDRLTDVQFVNDMLASNVYKNIKMGSPLPML